MKRVGRLGLVALAVWAVATCGWADDGTRTLIQPGQIIYEFLPGGNTCYPDNWTFFGYPQTAFGFDADAEDGGGAYQAADWTGCDLNELPQCIWVGSGVGLGPFNHPNCVPGGVSDVNLDLHLGTGLSIRIKDNITASFGGTLGARVQLQLVDNDGTTAVIPRAILQNPAVNRMPKLVDSWQTYNFFFDGLDWAWDNDDAVAGTVPGLNLTHIKSIKLIWRRLTAAGVNVFEFDNITLIDAPVFPWADDDADHDVDLADLAAFQLCVGNSVPPDCASLDANGDGVIDAADWQVWKDCMQGPGVTTGFYAWAY